MTHKPFTWNDVRGTQKEMRTLFGALYFRPLSMRLTWLLARTPLNPRHVTWLSLGAGALGAWLLAFGRGYWPPVGGALFFHLAQVLDCTDGELARLTGDKSVFGARLDSIFDRLKDCLAFAAIGVGLYLRTGNALAPILASISTMFYMAYHYASSARPAYWSTPRSDQEYREKMLFRLGQRLRLGGSDTMTMVITGLALVNYNWLIVLLWVWVLLGGPYLGLRLYRLYQAFRQAEDAPVPSPSGLRAGAASAEE